MENQQLTVHDNNDGASCKHQLWGVWQPCHDLDELPCTAANLA